MLYRREIEGEYLEKEILLDRGKLRLSPVEPFHKSVGISTHLSIKNGIVLKESFYGK